jgi:asparagine synthase (glutamine-hydrolysing)
MCGICGVIQLGGEPRPVVAPDVFDRMTDLMAHRGPDDRGVLLEPGAALGARRLAIVDLADGHQPLANETGAIWAAQNGELYNHEAVRRDLARRGHRLQTRCDTEVIPHLYEELGTGFPRALRGKFGLAVWDRERRRAVLARDRLGVKPLYYAVAGDLLVFASELKSLLASGLVRPELDLEAVDSHLTLGFVPAPRTLLSGVWKLLPGELLVAGEDGVRQKRYWRHPDPTPDRPAAGRDEYARGLMERLEEAVRLRLMSDVPLGAMLSGGLDSSLIVALMARHMSEPVKTFSVGFREDGSTNELADARFVAREFGTDHHELELSLSDEHVDLAELVWSLDEPVADLSALGFLALSQLAAQHVTVALSGQGADELLGGYLKHRAAAGVSSWQRVPAFARRRAAPALRRAPGRLRRAGRTLAADGPAERLLEMSGQLPPELARSLLKPDLAAAHGAWTNEALLALADGNGGGDPLATTLNIDARLALPDDMLHYFDRASMAHSLEVRVPFLDHELVEYCARIPPELKVRRLQTKHILKYAARGIVPDRIIDKRKIGFFRGASQGWIRSQLDGALADYLLAPAPAYSDLLERSAVEQLLRDATRTRRRVQLALAVLMLEVWLREFLPRALPPSRSVRSGPPGAEPSSVVVTAGHSYRR